MEAEKNWGWGWGWVKAPSPGMETGDKGLGSEEQRKGQGSEDGGKIDTQASSKWLVSSCAF
jgi:hypothetical protein